MALPKVVFRLPEQKWLLILPVFLLVVTLILGGLYWRKTQGFELNLASFLKKKPKPGDCLVLEQKYCRLGKPVYQDDKLAFVGFKLPQEASIFAPFDGNFSNTPTFFVKKDEDYLTYPGITIDVLSENSRYGEKSFAAVYYDIEKKPEVNYEAKKGVMVGQVSEKSLLEYGDYNFLVSFSEFNQETKSLSPNENELRDLFKL